MRTQGANPVPSGQADEDRCGFCVAAHVSPWVRWLRARSRRRLLAASLGEPMVTADPCKNRSLGPRGDRSRSRVLSARATRPLMLDKLRPLVETMPVVPEVYRSLRDQIRAMNVRPGPTPFGFLFGGHRAMAGGEFEPREVEFARTVLGYVDVFVDVGANLGLYSCLARWQGRKVVAFEPLFENLLGLYANLSANGWTDIEVLPVALSDKAGLVELFGGGTGASLVRCWSGGSARYRRTVPTTTMDLIVGHRFPGQKMFLKVDVEGAELCVLRGATAVLSRTPAPTWMVEICLTEHHPDGANADFAAVFERFWEFDYEAQSLDDDRPIMRQDVESWVRNGRRTRGSGNFVFSRHGR